MFVKDYMSRDLITVEPRTSISQAQDLMQKYQINRLPVMAEGKLIGLVTKESLAKLMPSEATSLSVYELNYLLSKLTCKDAMERQVKCVSEQCLLTEAAALMRDLNIGVLLVVDQEELLGLITDKDIFKSFIDISGYDQPGVTLVLELNQDRQGVIEELGDALVEVDENLSHLVVYPQSDGSLRLVLQLDRGHSEAFVQAVKAKGYQIHGIYES
ncbi:CBS domain-containing protein [Ignavigranum ruoffiae]|uniref:CBS domain-containing protein n=1 Tax=Ignavigranum ruoffiae TaxID=89093 RepID=UPI002353C526|nr:CBS domain-containing protein [Ignavigranum ruoffiae]